ncbi:MAG TPA: ACT domain-containing protein [Candidatus Eubacterium faecipullorum]|uniref:ACT domain-containing protein n=1 Tax=Candidatus Eubacterium faecipullorum TaxID=2838571 RepID=A0A9D1REE2_9FIRM|nr:ACT domain-containing protein [Candidatus Eubacterium faecipullorum]
MAKYKYILVNQELLPDVYARVIAAKSLLASGEAANASQAAKMAGISRSAYYKYKDGVFEYDPQNGGEVLTLSLRLMDTKGVLSAVTAELYRLGANVLSINQNVPKNGVADVLLAVYTAEMSVDVDSLIECLKDINGVRAVDMNR